MRVDSGPIHHRAVHPDLISQIRFDRRAGDRDSFGSIRRIDADDHWIGVLDDPTGLNRAVEIAIRVLQELRFVGEHPRILVDWLDCVQREECGVSEQQQADKHDANARGFERSDSRSLETSDK
jgi:hypothetical protein